MRNPLINCKLNKLIDVNDGKDQNWVKVYQESTAFQKEYGISNTLFVSHFLEWYHPQKEQFLISPLVLIPALIIKKRKIDTEWEVQVDESDAFLNPTLLRLLGDFYDVSRIEINNEGWKQELLSKFESHQNSVKISDDLVQLNQWQLIQASRAGNFNYKKSTLVYDYDTIIENCNGTVSRLLEGDLVETALTSEHELCLPLDDSQSIAVSYALDNNASIQGPPGTGKSHTIVQLIYEYLKRNKKILFVSEKSAALEVVYEQLKKDKMSSLVAFFNGESDEKKNFYKLLKKSWEAFHDNEFEQIDNFSNDEFPVLNYYLDRYHDTGYSSKFLVDRLIEKENYPSRETSIQRYPELEDWLGSYDFLEQVEVELGQPISQSFLCRINKAVFSEKQPVQLIHKRVDEGMHVLDQLKALSDNYQLNKTLKGLTKLSIASSILSMVNKTQLDLLNTEHKSYKSFGNLAKKYDLVKSKLTRQHQLTSKWKNKPTKSEITELIDLLKHHHAPKGVLGLLKRRSPMVQKAFEGFDRELSDVGKIQLLEELRQEWNLQGELEEIQIKLSHQYGIKDPDREIAFILNLRTKLNEIDTNDYLILLEHEKSIELISKLSELNSAIQHFTHLVKFTFKGQLPDELNELKHFFENVVLELPKLEKLGFSLDNYFKLPLGIQDFLASEKGSLLELDGLVCAHHLQLKNKFEIGFKSFAGAQLERDLVKYQRVIKERSAQRITAIKYQVYQKIQEVEKLLNTPASKLSTDQKELKKRLKVQKRVLIHELNKKQRHLPVKKIEQDCRELLSVFQTVWMMNPLAVSQYLENEKDAFDVVIFDESSQIPIEDTLPAIYRSKQVIVVGDEQQMPPSNYFSGAIENGLTVLTQANSSFKKFMLSWHYRSRHPELIQFSNQNFYEGELKTFPPVSKESPIEFIHHNGVYDSGSNTEEAGMIAQELAKESDLKKCAVIAFSREQEKTIRKALHSQGITDENLLIRNLENVQGIERDIIYISVGYGYNNEGVFRKNFGPINQEFGLNRLNVMVSRAKHKMKVFSPVKRSDFDLSDNLGVQCLADFLGFVEQQSEHQTNTSNTNSIIPINLEQHRLSLYNSQNSCSVEAYVQHETGKILLIEPGLNPSYDLVNTYATLKERFNKVKVMLHYDYLLRPKQFYAELERFFS